MPPIAEGSRPKVGIYTDYSRFGECQPVRQLNIPANPLFMA